MENFKPIPGWKRFYEVSDKGRVRSVTRRLFLDHPTGRKIYRVFKGRILRAGITQKGYPLVVLSRSRKREAVYVHDLVSRTFIGRKPRGLEVCHGNGIPSDNRLSNLRYDTRAANSADRFRHEKARIK